MGAYEAGCFDYYLDQGNSKIEDCRAYRAGFHTEPDNVTLAEALEVYAASVMHCEEAVEDFELAARCALTDAERNQVLTSSLDARWELATGATLTGNEWMVQALDFGFEDPIDPLGEEIEQLQEAINWYTQATGGYTELLASEHFSDVMALQQSRVHPISGDQTPYLDLQRLALASAKKSRAYLEPAERQYRKFTPDSKAEAENTLRQGFSLATAELTLLESIWDDAVDDVGYHALLRNISDMQRLFRYLQEGKNPFGYGPEHVPFHFQPKHWPDNNYEQTKALADAEWDAANEQVENAVGRQQESDDNWVILQQRLEEIRSEYNSQLVQFCGTNAEGEPDLEKCHENPGGEMSAQLLRIEAANQRMELVLQQMENQNELIRIEQDRAAKVADIQTATAEMWNDKGEKLADLASQEVSLRDSKSTAQGITGIFQGLLSGGMSGGALPGLTAGPSSFNPYGAVAGGLIGAICEGANWAHQSQVAKELKDVAAEQEQLRSQQWAEVHYAEAEITDVESEALIKQYMLRYAEYKIELSIATNNLDQELARLDGMKTQVEYLLAEKAKAEDFTVAMYQDPAGRVLRDYFVELADGRFEVALDYAYRAGRALEYEINQDPDFRADPLTSLGDLYGICDTDTLDAALAQMDTAYNDWLGRPDVPSPQLRENRIYLSQAVGFEDAYDPDLGRVVTREEKFNAFVRDPANRDENGNLKFTFQTSIYLGNQHFSTAVFNDKIASIKMRVWGTNLGDDRVVIHLKQSGTSFMRTQDAFKNGGPDDVRVYNVSPLKASIMAATNEHTLPDEVAVNQELACRSVAFTNWTLTLDQVNEPMNFDVDVDSIEEIELLITHEAYTLQDISALGAQRERGLDIFEPPPNREYQPVETATDRPFPAPSLIRPANTLRPAYTVGPDLTDTYVGTVVISRPVHLPSLDLVIVLTDTAGSLSGYIDSAHVLGYPIVDEGTKQGPAVSGSWSGNSFDLQSEFFAGTGITISRQVILHTGVIGGYRETLSGVYSETLRGLTPDPLVISGNFLLSRSARLPPASRTLYVDGDASGANDGLSWANAFTDLQSALTFADAGDEIWVAEGTYKPTSGTDRSATFQLKSGVGLYGGFAGTETSRDQRDWVAHPTLLSGDIGAVDDGSDNSYHVLTGSGTDATAILDGFTVTGGHANGGSWPDFVGGGMYNDSGSPTLTNVTFSGNVANNDGGGMGNNNSSPRLTNVTFSGNSAGNDGGGMGNNNSSPTLVNVTFSGNSASNDGGGMGNSDGSPTLVNVTFSGNSANNDGGGMGNSDGSPTLTNVTFSGNSATYGGGMGNSDGSPTLVNVTFSGNSATYGGGMGNNNSSPRLTNCILWGNSASNGAQIDNDSSTPAIGYSLVQGSGGSGASWDSSLGTDEGGNIDADPKFLDPDGPDDIVGTLDNDLHLRGTSPAIDAGDNSAVPGDILDLDGDGTTAEKLPFDLDGYPRIINGIVDMGACEAPRQTQIYLPQ
jgi:hypothetical protein